MMMSSVELYRTLGEEVGLETGSREVGLLRLASSPERMEELTRQSGWAKTFGLPLELISAAEAQVLLPADDDRRRGRRGVPPDRRLHRSLAAHVRARRGSPPRRRRDLPAHSRHADPRRARPGGRRRHGQGPDRGRGRRECRRDVRQGDRRARRHQRPHRPDGPRVPDHQTDRAPDRHADDARPVAARLLPSRVRWADHGRLRAEPGALVARRYPGGLQRQAPRRGLAPVRGADGERDRPCAVARGGRGRQADQRPGGLHPRRRVHPRADLRPRPLDRRRLLRSRARGRRRTRATRRRVDRPGHPVARCLAHGLAPLRPRVPLAELHARPNARGLRDLLRREVPGSRATGRTAAAALADLSAPLRAWRRLRREVGLERANWFEPNAAKGDESLRPRGWAVRLWSPAIGAEHVACRETAALFDETSFAKIEIRRRGRRVPRDSVRKSRRPGCRRDHLHLDAEQPRWDRVRLHGDPPRLPSASGSSPAPRSASTTSPGSASTRPGT